MQVRTTAYHDLDTARLHNTHVTSVIKAGVYRGYFIRANPADRSMLDIISGADDSSILMTVEGVRIEETDDILGVLRIRPADSSFPRWDLVVAEYTWSPDNTIQQLYKIVKGRPATSTTSEPIKPVPSSAFQIPLAWVYVRPRTAIGGISRVEILQTDIILAPKASGIESPTDVSTLKPEVDPTNRMRIFVYRGVFPTIDGSNVVFFDGGYSDEIDDSAMIDGETRYFLFGISDDGEVGVAGESSDSNIDPYIGANVIPLCIAQATKRGSITTIDSLVDIRFPFSRRVAPQPEEASYQGLLNTSVFQYVRIDDLSPGNFIDLDTLTPDEDELTAVIEHGNTSLSIKWDDSGSPSSDVRISTTNLLADSPISNVRHIMLLVDTDASGVSYDYSTVSATSGFTGFDLAPGTLKEIPGSASSIFIRFKIPASNFQGVTVKRIFSYALYMVLDSETLNEQVFTGLGLDTVGFSVPNMICNGDFRIWSRPDANGITPDIYSRDKVEYPIQVAGVGNREKIFAADGWQFTKLTHDPRNGVITRVLWSRDAIGSLEETTIDTAIEWKGSAGGDSAGSLNYLEFRVESMPDFEGEYVTFAFDYKSYPKEAVGIRIVFYERQSDGSLSAVDDAESGPVREEGTLLIRSNTQINDKVFAVGFIVVFQQTTGESTIYVKKARAAIGDFRILEFTRPVGADDTCRKYYERGSIYATANLADGEDIGASVQFGSKKVAGLAEGGSPRVRQIPVADSNRSVNTYSLEYTGDANAMVVKGQSSGGLSIVDLDWESEVIYPVE